MGEGILSHSPAQQRLPGLVHTQCLACSWLVTVLEWQGRERTLMKEGLSVTFLASSIALRMASMSVLPSATCCVCQPSASYLACTFSVKEMSVWPSMEICSSAAVSLELNLELSA